MSESDKIRRVADSADAAAQEAANSRWFERVARADFIANGLVYTGLGVTAAAIGLGHAGGEADQSGVLSVRSRRRPSEWCSLPSASSAI